MEWRHVNVTSKYVEDFRDKEDLNSPKDIQKGAKLPLILF